MTSLSNSSLKYILLSYHKNHQELVFKIYSYLINANLPVWINMQDGINKQRYLTEIKINLSYQLNVLFSRERIIDKICALVCFMTPMYQASKHCQEEVELVKSEGIPLIAVHLLLNWKPSGWLSKFHLSSFLDD